MTIVMYFLYCVQADGIAGQKNISGNSLPERLDRKNAITTIKNSFNQF